MHFGTCGFKECLSTAAARSAYQRKRLEHASRQGDASPLKRGVGIASMLHVGGGAKIYPSDGCGTILKIDDFAHVTLITGASEIGQGSETVLAQLVCEELGLPLSSVTVVNNDTDITPWDVGVHASPTTFIAGNSAIGAAKKAKDKILAAAAAKSGRASGDLQLSGGFVVTPEGEKLFELGKFLRSLHFSDKADLVMTTFYYEPPSHHQDREFKGDVSAAYAWASQVAEVEVDTRTGIVKLLSITAAHDVGRVLNRLGIEGQIEGGLVMGQGYALTENLIVEGGAVKNPSFRDYKLVTAPRSRKWTSPSSRPWTARGRRARRASARRPRSASPRRWRTRFTTPPACASRRCRSRRSGCTARCAASSRRRSGTCRREAAHRPFHGAGALDAVRHAALRAARLAGDPHRGDALGCGPSGRSEPLHRRAGRGRGPAQLLHRAERRQGGDRAQPE